MSDDADARQGGRRIGRGDPAAAAGAAVPAARPRWPHERGPEVIDVYRRATDAMRDVTKWIVTVVPGAGVVVAVTTLVPDIAALAPADRSEPLMWVGVGVACVVLVVLLAARVLAATQTGWGAVVRQYGEDTAGDRVGGPAARSLAAELDRESVLRLYGYRSATDFFRALVSADAPDDPSWAVAAGTVVMDFSAYRTVRGRFFTFCAVGAIAGVAGLAAIAGAQFAIAGAPSADDRPARDPVSIIVPAEHL